MDSGDLVDDPTPSLTSAALSTAMLLMHVHSKAVAGRASCLATLLDDVVRIDVAAEEITPGKGSSPYIALAYRALGEEVRASI